MKKWLIITDYWEKTGIGNYAIDLFESLKDEIDIDFLNLYNTKWFSIKPSNWYIINIWNYFSWIFFWVTWSKLLNYLKNNRYDYIILWHQWMWYLIPYLNKLDIEVISILHDMMSYNTYKNNILHIIFRKVSTDKIIKSDKIIFISENTKKDFFDFWFEFLWETTVIYSYIDSNKFYKLDNKDYIYSKYNIDKKYTKIFISVTNGQSHKNDITFFKLANEYKNYLFIKVWNFSVECNEYIKNNNLNNILLLNWLNYIQLRELYNICDVYINTSIKEWFWYPPFEALFCWTKLLTNKSINIEVENWIYIVDDYYDIEWYKKWISKLINEELVFNNIHKYRIERFKNEFQNFLK